MRMLTTPSRSYRLVDLSRGIDVVLTPAHFQKEGESNSVLNGTK